MSRFMRPGWVLGHVLVVVAALVCMRLAWWQLDRSEESSGTIQNVGYAILWPAFGVAFIYMWIKFIRLEVERSELEEQEHEQLLDQMLAEAESLTVGAASDDVGSPTVGDGSRGRLSGAGTMDASAVAARDADFVGIVGDEDDDDAELIAYNRALAALADKERRAG